MKSKKLLSGLAVLVLLTGVGSLGAQELKFDGYVNSGIGVVSTDNEDTDTFLKAFGVDSNQNGYRFRFNGTYQNEAANAGVKFRLQSQSRLDRGGYFSLPFAYGWLKFANDILYAAGGIVDDGGTADWWFNGDRINNGLGALLKATPVAGLELGLGAFVVNVQNGANNSVLGATGALNFADVRPKFGDVKYAYSAAYTLPDVFRLGAAFRWKNKAGYDNNGYDFAAGKPKDGYLGRDESSRLLGDFRYLGVKNLTAVLTFSFDKLENFDESGNIVFVETFAYKLDNLNVGLNANQYLYVRGDTDTDLGLLFNLWVSYTINKIVPRLDLVYFLGGQSFLGDTTTANATNYRWQRVGFQPQPTAGLSDKDDDYSVFSIRPSFKFNLNARTFIEIGDVIDYSFANFAGAYKDSKDANKKSRLSNVFYIDLRWSF